MFDTIIKNGTIIDGSGSPGYRADIAIKNGKIVLISDNISDDARYIDASGLIVAPGFIDSHSHADAKILQFPQQHEKLEQGITTSIAGQCGGSAAPSVDFSFGSFLHNVAECELGANFLCFVGHGTIRKAIMGDRGDSPTPEEMFKIESLLRECFEHGAAGLSFGLFYAPGCYATTEEAVRLARIAAEYHKPISAHIRSESDELIEATSEFIAIAKESGARSILSHHKSVQRRNWGKTQQTLKLLDDAILDGVDIYCDVYPYCATSTRFSQAFVPHQWRAGGTAALLAAINDQEKNTINKEHIYKINGQDFSWIIINNCNNHEDVVGLRLDEIAAKWNMDPYDTAMKLIVDSNDQCNASFFSICEADFKRVLCWDRSMICTDSGMAGQLQMHHPRMTGSFPRAIGRYVRQQSVVSMEAMINKMTGLPADVYNIRNKGYIKVGYDADICIFDPNSIIDQADFVDCKKKAKGLNYVLVDGKIVVEDAIYNGVCLGKVL